MSILSKLFNPKASAVPPAPARFYVHLVPMTQQDQTVSMEGMAKIFQAYQFFSLQKSVDATRAAITVSSNFYDHISREVLANTEDLTTLSQIMKMEDNNYHLYLSANEVLHYLKTYTEGLHQTRLKLQAALTTVDQELSNFSDLSKLDEVLGSN